MFDIVFGANQFIAVGAYSRVFKSKDGSEWSQVSVPFNSYPRAVTFGNGTFIAVGDSTVLASRDGDKWEIFRPPTVQSLRGLVSVSDRHFAVGNGGTIDHMSSLTLEQPWYIMLLHAIRLD